MELSKEQKLELIMIGTGIALIVVVYAITCAVATVDAKKRQNNIQAEFFKRYPCRDPERDAANIAKESGLLAEEKAKINEQVWPTPIDTVPSEWSENASGGDVSSN